MPIALIYFTCASPVASWHPSINPKHGGGYGRNKERFQSRILSDGGDLYSYDHGSKSGRILQWDMLPAADMATLLTFLTAVKGGLTPFTYTDYNSVAYTVSRVLNFQSFPIKNITFSAFFCTIELEVA